MFSLFFKNPTKKLKKEYSATLERAMQAQRRGDIRSYSELSDKAEQLMHDIDQIEKKQ